MDLSQLASLATRILLLPPTNLLVLIAFGFLLRRRWPATGRAVSAIGVLVLLVISTNAGALLLVRPLEDMNPPLRELADTRAQAIVVLGAGSVERAREYGDIDVPDAVGLVRLQYAAFLQHRTGLPLLASGGNAVPQRNVASKAEMMARTLREDFKTPVRWVEGKSENTEQNAVYSARMLQADGIKRVLLVTHAMHMPRARQAFEERGIEVVPAPTLFYSHAVWSPYMLIPSASGLYRSYYATHEWVGLWWYKMKKAA